MIAIEANHTVHRVPQCLEECSNAEATAGVATWASALRPGGRA